jgi:uncharacterized protein (DUF362 family)
MTQVSLVKGDNRQDNVRQALELIGDDIDLDGRHPVIKVNFVSTHVALSATHVDAVAAVVEFLRDRGEKEITVAEGAAIGSTVRGFKNFGYQELADRYGLRFEDLNDPDTWKTVYAVHPDFRPCPIKLAHTMVNPDNYVISVARPKTHGEVGVTLTAKNVIMGAIMLVDKYRIHPSEAGVKVLDFNLFNIMQHLHIDLAVLDGFEGMEGKGPVSGNPVNHRVAVAGTDYLAVDRVGTEIMGVDFDTIRYLNFLWDYGFGEADLERIKIIGESIETCRRPYKMSPRFLKIRRQEAKGTDSGLYRPN